MDSKLEDMIRQVMSDVDKRMMGGLFPMTEKKPAPTPATVGGRPTFKPQPGHPPYVSRIDPTCPELMTVQLPNGESRSMLAKEVKNLGFFPKPVSLLSSKEGPDGKPRHEVRVELFKGQTGEVWVSEGFLKEHGWDKAERAPAVPAKPIVGQWSTAKDPIKELGDFFGAPLLNLNMLSEDELAATKAKSFNEGFELAKNRGKQDLETAVRIESEKAFRSGAAEAKKEMEDYNSQPFAQTLSKLYRDLGAGKYPTNYYVEEAVKSLREQGVIRALENGGHKLLQDKLKAHYSDGKAVGLQEGYEGGLMDGETKGKQEERDVQRQLWDDLKQSMRTDVRMMGLTAETQRIIDLVLEEAAISYKVEGMIQALSSISAGSQELGYKAGLEDGADKEKERAKAEFKREYDKLKQTPIIVNFNSMLGVEAFDSKAPQMGQALVTVGQAVEMGQAVTESMISAIQKTPTSDIVGAKKEGSMSKDRLLESLRDAYYSHAPQETILSLLHQLEELAFDEGREQGYEEGLEAQEETQQGSEEPKEIKMSESTDTLSKILVEGKLAALNIGAKQLVKLVKEPMIAFLAGHLAKDDPSMRARVAEFLGTDIGEGIMELLISLGLTMLPQGMDGEHLQGLSSTLRVRAMTNVGDAVVDLLMAPVRSVISNVLTPAVNKALPAESVQARVSIPVELTQEVSEPVSSKRK